MEAWRAELYHFGIKDMHWGIRRYQNKDGSLTPAGRKRYGLPSAAEERRIDKNNKRIEGNLSRMSNEELSKAVSRANLENKYAQQQGYRQKKTVTKDDLNRAVGEDISNTSRDLQNISQNSSNIARNMQNLKNRKEREKYRDMDLSHMSDEDLRREVNRLNLEQSYKDAVMRSQPYQKTASDYIESVATVVGVAASAVGIAASIHTLRTR